MIRLRRAFHSPFVALNRFSPSQPAPTPVYEKQHDPSPEPHLSSSGTRTYLVSEPDPSNAPYQVPTGAYSASTSYTSPAPPNQADTSVGHNAAQESAEVLRGGGIGLNTKTGRL